VKTEHKLNPLKHVRGRVEASCSCGTWFRYTDNHDGQGEERMRTKHAEHVRETRRRK
jgi:hypothetical protein